MLSKGSFFRRFLFVLTLFAILLVGAASLLPQVLSSDWGHTRILGWVNGRISGTVDFSSLRLSWSRGQQIKNLTLTDADGEEILSIGSLSSDITFWNLLWNDFHIPSTTFTDGVLNLHQSQEGTINLHHALQKPYHRSKRRSSPTASPSPRSSSSMTLPFTGDIIIERFHLVLVPWGMEPTHITDLTSKISISRETEDITVKISGKTEQGELRGAFGIQALVHNVDADTSFQLAMHCEDFPVAALDQLIALKNPLQAGLLTAALGDRLELHAEVGLHPDGGTVWFDIETPKFRADISAQSDTHTLSLTKPGTIVLTVTPDFLELLATKTGDNLSLSAPTTLRLEIEQLTTPMDCSLFWDQTSFLGNLSADAIHFTAPLDTISVEKFKLSVSTPSPTERFTVNLQALLDHEHLQPAVALEAEIFDSVDSQGHIRSDTFRVTYNVHLTSIPLTLIDHLLALRGVLVDGLGDQLDIDMRGKITSNDLATTLDIRSDYLSIENLRMETQDHLLALVHPCKLAWTFTPSSAEHLSFSIPDETLVQATLQQFSMPLQTVPFCWSKIRAEGLLTIDTIAGNHPLTTWLSEIQIPWIFDGANDRLSWQLQAKTDNDGTLDANITLSHTSVDASIKIDRLPMKMVETLVGRDDLRVLIGETIDLTLVAHLNVPSRYTGNMDLSFTGEDLEFEAAVNITDELSLQSPLKPLKFRWTVTPKRLVILQKIIPQLPKFTITEPTHLTLTLKKLNIPMVCDTPWESAWGWCGSDLSVFSIVGDGSISTLTVKNGDGVVKLENAIATIDAANLQRSLSFHLQAEDKIHLKIDIENPLSSDKGINLLAMSPHIEGTLQRCPTFFMPILIRKLLGDRVNAVIAIDLDKMTGPVQIDLDADHCRGKINGLVNKSIFTLNSPITAEIDVTPQLSKSILKHINPLLISAVASEKPIKFTVDTKDFVIPIYNYEFTDIVIGNATLDMGKMTLNNGDHLGLIVGILKLHRVKKEKNMTVWFTPLYASLTKGIITCKRMDALIADDFPIATWGNVDLTLDWVDMVIGLSGDALKKAFHLKNIKSDYFLQMPMRGPTSKAKIDSKRALKKIAILIAKEQTKKKKGFLGKIIDAVTKQKKEKKPPPPTTQPFPWG